MGVIILHSQELARSIMQDITNKAEEIKIMAKGSSACKNIGADERCDATYETGIRQTNMLKEHLEHTVKFMNMANMVLVSADQEAAAKNAE